MSAVSSGMGAPQCCKVELLACFLAHNSLSIRFSVHLPYHRTTRQRCRVGLVRVHFPPLHQQKQHAFADGHCNAGEQIPQPLHAAAMEALARFERWTVKPVPRAQNAAADRLVNEALDAPG